jgi:hypothetical protein
MGMPKITAADLIALRDGGELAVGIEMAVGKDIAAQLALLESRLLALALSMPRGLSAADDAAPMKAFFDADTLGAYVRGELNDEALTRFEAAVRGHPSRFAELVAFKNAYFGRSRSTATSSRIAPPIERDEIGVLTLHSVGGLTFLSWEGPGLIEPPRAFALRTPTFKPNAVYDIFEQGNFGKPLDDRELREFHEEMGTLLQEVRAQLLFAQKSNRPEELEKLVTILDIFQQMSARQQDNLRALREQLAELLDSRLEAAAYLKKPASLEAEVKLAIAGHRLHFASLGEQPGALTLRITPANAEAEFTWVRPGVDFTNLQTTSLGVHRLTPVRDEAQLLIDAPNEPTRVVRVVIG